MIKTVRTKYSRLATKVYIINNLLVDCNNLTKKYCLQGVWHHFSLTKCLKNVVKCCGFIQSSLYCVDVHQ